jgi:uncharacterized YigZ family protein
MRECFKVLYQGGTGEITEKKSRFIAAVYPVKSEGEAQSYIDAARKKYWDARHNCYAFVIGKNHDIQRYSDDGEPQGTAGKPILEVLIGEEIHDCLIIVTRYFGGILLGTGGLVRAYQKAAKEGIAQSQVMEKYFGKRIGVICDYADVGRIQYLAANEMIYTENALYGADVEFSFLVNAAQAEAVAAKMTENTAGRALIEIKDEVVFGVAGGKVIMEDT